MWPQIIAFVIAVVIAYVTRPKPVDLAPPHATDIKVPQIGEGRPIGVAFGKPWIKDPTCVWYGDLHIEPIKKKGGK